MGSKFEVNFGTLSVMGKIETTVFAQSLSNCVYNLSVMRDVGSWGQRSKSALALCL